MATTTPARPTSAKRGRKTAAALMLTQAALRTARRSKRTRSSAAAAAAAAAPVVSLPPRAPLVSAKAARREAIQSLRAALRSGPPSYRHLHSDVFDVESGALAEQRAALREHVRRYEAEYALPSSATEGL